MLASPEYKASPAIGPSLPDCSALGVRHILKVGPLPKYLSGKKVNLHGNPRAAVTRQLVREFHPDAQYPLVKDLVREESTRHGLLGDQGTAWRIEAQAVQSEIKDPHRPVRSPLQRGQTTKLARTLAFPTEDSEDIPRPVPATDPEFVGVDDTGDVWRDKSDVINSAIRGHGRCNGFQHDDGRIRRLWRAPGGGDSGMPVHYASLGVSVFPAGSPPGRTFVLVLGEQFSRSKRAMHGGASACCWNRENHQRIVQDFVDNPILTDANPPKTPQFALQCASGERLFAQPVDGPYDSDAIVPRNPRQLPGRRSLNPNRVAHAGLHPSQGRGRRGLEAAPRPLRDRRSPPDSAPTPLERPAHGCA